MPVPRRQVGSKIGAVLCCETSLPAMLRLQSMFASTPSRRYVTTRSHSKCSNHVQGELASAHSKMACRQSAPASPSSQDPIALLTPSQRPTAAAAVSRLEVQPACYFLQQSSLLHRQREKAAAAAGGGATRRSPSAGGLDPAAPISAIPASKPRRVLCSDSAAARHVRQRARAALGAITVAVKALELIVAAVCAISTRLCGGVKRAEE